MRHGSGLRLLAAPTDALEGAEVDDEAISRILDESRGRPLYVVDEHGRQLGAGRNLAALKGELGGLAVRIKLIWYGSSSHSYGE